MFVVGPPCPPTNPLDSSTEAGVAVGCYVSSIIFSPIHQALAKIPAKAYTMKLAVIGSGISGLVAAYRLSPHNDVTLFESNSYLGGHTNTVDVRIDGERHRIDPGFIVFNDRTYPNFCRLLDELGVDSVPTSMSFSVTCRKTGLEYNGSTLNGLFAQRSNLLRPGFYRMLRDILRFNHDAPRILSTSAREAMTVADYVRQHGYSRQFVDHYLLPMGAAIWSCPPTTFGRFPIRFVVEFYDNHGLLSLSDRPTWRVVRGGSSNYVSEIAQRLRGEIRLNCPVATVRRNPNFVELVDGRGRCERFDEVIFACHADQALRILADATPIEMDLLSAFPYETSMAVLHTDRSVLPQRRRAWASWNYHLRDGGQRSATVTYYMNKLQHIHSRHDFCVTLNETDRIDPARVLGRFKYGHPVFTTQRKLAQSRHQQVIRCGRTSFCGAYWGNGFHEDGVNSALAVCRRFESQRIEIPSPRAPASTALREVV